MPIYEFKCSGCGKVFEGLFKSSSDIGAAACPACKSKDVKKLMSTFAPSMGGSKDFACNTPSACPSSGCCGGSCANVG